MLFPISDDDSKLKRTAWVTIIFIIANIAVFVYQTKNPNLIYGFSAIPKEIMTNTDLVEPQTVSSHGQSTQVPQLPGPSPIFLTLFTAMFMHGSLMHIGSNMLFLWIFGDNVELRFGTFRFILFYLISGIAASLTHIFLDPDSVIPSLGASGAIAGVLGAYLVMFPRNKVNALFFIKIVSVPAIVVIGLWGVMQFLPLFTQKKGAISGIAYAAHAGGLVAGLVLGLIFRLATKEEPDSILYRNYERDEKAKRIW